MAETKRAAKREIRKPARPRDAQGHFVKRSEAEEPSEESTELKPLSEAGKRRLVNVLLAQAELAAKTGEFKVTTGDLIRLLQMQRELEPARRKQVTVRWVEDEAA
jgi:hypothetical protein